MHLLSHCTRQSVAAVGLRYHSIHIPLIQSTKWHTILQQSYNRHHSFINPYAHHNRHTTTLSCFNKHQCVAAINKHTVSAKHNQRNISNTAQNNTDAAQSHMSSTQAPTLHKTSTQTINKLTKSYKKSMTPNMLHENKWLVLSKIRIGIWNMIAASLAYMVMPHGTMLGLFYCASGTLLYASSSLAWNQLNEIEYDKKMIRTRNRPIIKQTITVQQAKLFIATTSLGGFVLCYLANGYAPAIIGLSTVLLYVYVYTPLKRRTIYNTEVGAVIGALPVLLGCCAADGIDSLFYIQTWVQYGLMFAWQIPHFYTIAWRQRIDYARAGFKMISYNDLTGKLTTLPGIKWFILLWCLPFTLDYFGYTTEMFIVTSIALNLLFSGSYLAFILNPTRYAATTQYISYIHILGMLFTLNLFTLGKAEWATLAGIRKAGYSYCIHPILMATGIKLDDLPSWLCTHIVTDKQDQNSVVVSNDGTNDTTQQLIT